MADRLIIKRGKIGAFAFDATLSEKHTASSQVTSYPVEDGGSATDGIRPEPMIVELSGIVGEYAVIGGDGAIEDTPDRRLRAFELLSALRDAGERVRVVTSVRTYEDMAIMSVVSTIDTTTGKALAASATLKQVTVVSTSSVAFKRTPTNKPTASQKKKDGDKTGETVEKPASLLIKAARAASNLTQQNVTTNILGG